MSFLTRDIGLRDDNMFFIANELRLEKNLELEMMREKRTGT